MNRDILTTGYRETKKCKPSIVLAQFQWGNKWILSCTKHGVISDVKSATMTEPQYAEQACRNILEPRWNAHLAEQRLAGEPKAS